MSLDCLNVLAARAGGPLVEFFKLAIGGIPAAASSQVAFASYVVAVLAYVLLSWRVVRNKNLLHHLRHLPPADRFRALQVEMGGVFLKEGISPEQWVQARIQRYYFIAFLFSVAVIAVVAVLVFLNVRSQLWVVGIAPIEDAKPFQSTLNDEKELGFTGRIHGIDIKLKNSGNDSAFVTAVRLLIYPGRSHPAPCGMAVEPSKVYDFPINIVLGYLVSADNSEARSLPIQDRLPSKVAMSYPSDYDGFPVFLSEALKVSQVAPPRGVDRFQIAFRTNPRTSKYPKLLEGEGPDGEYSPCAGGTIYPIRLVLTYDNNRSLVTDPLQLRVNYGGAFAITR
jgi:hypothetical protein